MNKQRVTDLKERFKMAEGRFPDMTELRRLKKNFKRKETIPLRIAYEK